MSEYRRLISYIYEYEGKEKGKNVGFVKLEARNGQCRLNVNVKRMYVGGNAIGVYLLAKTGENVFLGNMFVRGGGGEFRATVDAKNVEGTGVGLDGYFGLTVHDVKNAWRSYRTAWEDAVVPASEHDAASVKPDEMPLAECEEKDEMSSEECLEEGKITSGECAEPDAILAETCIEQGVISAAECDFVTGPVAQDILPGSAELTGERELASVVREIEDEIAREAEEQETTESVLETEKQSPQSDVHGVSPELENPELLRYLQETEDIATDPEKLWQELRKSYPKIQPFDYDGGSEVLTIRPQDIGKLPRENWVYGNNSFLLHGYYNFRYLILVRLENPNGRPRYLIGIPGHYYSNEKYMATMFGFPNFVLSKKQPPNDGRFGYWYTDIKMR